MCWRPMLFSRCTSQAPIEEAFAQTCCNFHKLTEDMVCRYLTAKSHRNAPDHCKFRTSDTTPEALEHPAKHNRGTSSPQRSGCFLHLETKQDDVTPPRRRPRCSLNRETAYELDATTVHLEVPLAPKPEPAHSSSQTLWTLTTLRPQHREPCFSQIL